jgi:hypothetical protein
LGWQIALLEPATDDRARIRSMMGPNVRPLPGWYWIPLRVFLVTLLLTLLAFAVSTFLAIAGLIAWARLHDARPVMSLAYRDFGIPVAALVAAVALVSMAVVEIRHYRQTRALSVIERAN